VGAFGAVVGDGGAESEELEDSHPPAPRIASTAATPARRSDEGGLMRVLQVPPAIIPVKTARGYPFQNG